MMRFPWGDENFMQIKIKKFTKIYVGRKRTPMKVNGLKFSVLDTDLNIREMPCSFSVSIR